MVRAPWQDHRITTRIDVADYLSARRGALRAHATQMIPTEPFWFGLSDEELAEAVSVGGLGARRASSGTPAEASSRTTCSPASARRLERAPDRAVRSLDGEVPHPRWLDENVRLAQSFPPPRVRPHGFSTASRTCPTAATAGSSG